MTHRDRIKFAAEQLLRYGDGVLDERLLDVLDMLTDINDDMQHGRAKEIITETCQKASELLLAIAQEYEAITPQ